MAKTTQRIPKKLKKPHVVGPIIIFLLLAGITTGIMFALYSMLGLYTTTSKITEEYERLSYMARLYEQGGGQSNAENVYKLLDEAERDYIIFDKDGKVLHQTGENTSDNDGNMAPLFSGNGEVMLYEDTVSDYVHVTLDGEVEIPYFRLFRMVLRNHYDTEIVGEDISISVSNESADENGKAIEEVRDGENGMEVYFYSLGEDSELANVRFSDMDSFSFFLPVWMEIPVGEQFLRAKVYVIINLGDFAMLSVTVVALATLLVIIFIVLIVYLIVGVTRRKRILKLYITDQSTESYNWQGYLLKGEHLLRKGSSARKSFAAVNLVFINYRNYCMCHSVEEGDAVTDKIMEVLRSYMGKKEILAHSAPADYSMVLIGEDPDYMKMRLTSIILQLEKIDLDHVFHFQAGVDMIPIQKNKNDKPTRRKDFNLEEAYNNACTARDTMSENDGSGVAIFDEKLVEDRIWVDRVQEKQQQALDNEEFEVYYQPKYDPVTNQLKGAEALIRWQSPDYGFVSPGRIIPIFEKNGFITEIDHYMITHVARDQKRWLERGFTCVPVSVNVSRAHFIESDLAEQIRDMVDEAGTPHELVEIELTESAFFDDKNAIIKTINKLKSYGFTVSMDDFGSGYSSLNSLKDMPLDVLKLDAEFFRGENAGERGEIVVKEAIRLAKSLNMRTVAEGVEVKEQVDFLAEQGCDMIQGYYFAKPMPKLDYEERMKKNQEEQS